MSLNHHKLYMDNVFALAGTLVIKSEYSADCINNRLTALYGAQAVDPSQPATWKYYLNICGEYHPTDPQIAVRSLDTLQVINFTKANLAIHTATARAYQYGSRYYRELLAQYPDHESLILGVLYPATMSKVLNAPDFSVLSYPSDLVEPAEESLIASINTWLDKFKHRWVISAFHLTDELYGASVLGVMYGQLVPLIITLRLRACRTAEVHSYHVRQYLASHGMLDLYLSQLTRKQALFFYRNINYIERHSGKAATFEWLTEKVLTDRGLPLVGYEMRHDTSSMPGELTPDVVFTTTPLNRLGSKNSRPISTASVMAKEVNAAPGNLERITQSIQSTEERYKYSMQSISKTKILESTLVQNADAGTQSITETALSMWGWSAATNRYSVYTRVKNPVTGEELTLSMLQAYHYFFYAYCMVHSKQLETVPLIYSQMVPRIPAPTLAEVMNHVDTGYVPQENVIRLMLQNPVLGTFANTETFKEGCEAVFNSITAQSSIVNEEEHFYARGLMHGAFCKQYSDYLLSTSETGSNIREYFSAIDIPTTGFTDLEWQQIYLDLFEACTGFDMQAAVQTSELQKAMIRLMTQLSSYSVQFVSELSASNVRSLNWAAVRLGDNSGASRSYFEIIVSVIEWFKLKSNVHMYLPVDVFPISNRFVVKNQDIDLGLHEIPINITPNIDANKARVEIILDMGPFDFDDRYDPNADTSIPGMEAYLTMTDAEVAEVMDVYTSQCRQPPTIPTKVDLTDVIHNNMLNSFETMERRGFLLPSWKAYYGPQNMRYFTDENTVVVLDGIWYFGGENHIASFVPTIGHNKVESFKYSGTAPGPLNVTYYAGLIGPVTGPTFQVGYTARDIDIGTIGQLPQSMVMNFTHVFKQYTTTITNVTQVISDMVMPSVTQHYSFRLEQQLNVFALPAMDNRTQVEIMALKAMPYRVVMDPFDQFVDTKVLMSFAPNMNIYRLLPLYHLFNTPVSIPEPPNGAPTIQLTSAFRTVDIPDFATVMQSLPPG